MKAKLTIPRAVWIMVPAGKPTEDTITTLSELLDPGDIIIDGGNSNFRVSIEDGKRTAEKGIEFIDAGVSGGIWGLTEGYAMMVGGSKEAVAHLQPAFDTLAPENGFIHAGPVGSGHFVKMVHNGIEYGMMQAFAEGFELMEAIPEYDLDLAAIAESWRHGSVVRSWLLDLAANALNDKEGFEKIRGYVEDSGEGKWTVEEAINAAVPLPVITASLFARFASRQPESFAARINAALRNQFGGHAVRLEGGESSGPKGKPGESK
jgi:6-phosphogluconate dehydrogenase